jgi:hypothetical protein
MAIRKIEISALPVAESLAGLFTIGVDASGNSVRVSLEFLKAAVQAATEAATEAAQKAASAQADATYAKGMVDSQDLLIEDLHNESVNQRERTDTLETSIDEIKKQLDW